MSSGLDLSPGHVAALAARLEETRRALARVRYGAVFRVGVATCVLNPDSPLPADNFAASLSGGAPQVQATLERLPIVFAEAGRPEVVVHDSPSCSPELGLLAEETGYEAVEESAVLVLDKPARLAEGEPGRVVTPVAEAEELGVPDVLAEAAGYGSAVRRDLAALVGHRLDDPRYAVWAARRGGRLAGVAASFLDGGVGLVADLAVLPGARRRGLGRALVSAAAASCLTAGAEVVCASGETRGPGERFWTGLGFEPAYDEVIYTYPL
jgi:GNAT superfamily N-acetyltransferase